MRKIMLSACREGSKARTNEKFNIYLVLNGAPYVLYCLFISLRMYRLLGSTAAAFSLLLSPSAVVPKLWYTKVFKVVRE